MHLVASSVICSQQKNSSSLQPINKESFVNAGRRWGVLLGGTALLSKAATCAAQAMGGASSTTSENGTTSSAGWRMVTVAGITALAVFAVRYLFEHEVALPPPCRVYPLVCDPPKADISCLKNLEYDELEALLQLLNPPAHKMGVIYIEKGGYVHIFNRKAIRFWDRILACNKQMLQTLVDEKRRQAAFSSVIIQEPKPLKVLTDSEIIERNERAIVDGEIVRKKLAKRFASAQQRLDEGTNERLRASIEELTLREQSNHAKKSKSGEANSFAMQGKRPAMEDVVLIDKLERNSAEPYRVFGVFDGHCGSIDCAEFVAKSLLGHLAFTLNAMEEGNRDHIVELFDLCKLSSVKLSSIAQNAHLNANVKKIKGCTTSSFVLQTKEALWAACAGDSRMIVTNERGEATALSEDAKVQKLIQGPSGPYPAEYGRDVITRGGKLVKLWQPKMRRPSLRMTKSKSDTINMTRAVGHNPISSGINPRSKVIYYPLDQLSTERSYLIIASDGLWGAMSSNQAAKLVTNWSRTMNCGEMAKALAEKAFALGSDDNISVVIVDVTQPKKDHIAAADPLPSSASLCSPVVASSCSPTTILPQLRES